MKTIFSICAGVPLSGEILTQPETFLPGKLAAGHLPQRMPGQYPQVLPAFRGGFDFNPGKNMMAQPMLNGGLQ